MSLKNFAYVSKFCEIRENKHPQYISAIRYITKWCTTFQPSGGLFAHQCPSSAVSMASSTAHADAKKR